ncbi:MAG: DNA polymerase III subunit epsilon [Rhodospirillales bacterium]|nr:DNA polymerase III subunit epsilon [Rhodospirillales bacterium]MCB9996998.1 DNA polymerase III subunit epsilon [Rhodospirillales bacterium]
MREIVFDTETTGMDPSEGDKLVEIGCVELMNQVPTGRTYHQYINPERDVPAEAVAVHGLTFDMLKDKPTFSEIYTDFLEFIGEDSILIAHNAAFDMKFVNAELHTMGHAPLPNKRVKDSLLIAREKFPGSPASLDALCRRFSIDLSSRELHGALLDAQLLAEVWLELMGGRQHGLGLGADDDKGAGTQAVSSLAQKDRPFREPRPHAPLPEEREAHAAMLEKLTDPLWKDAG